MRGALYVRGGAGEEGESEEGEGEEGEGELEGEEQEEGDEEGCVWGGRREQRCVLSAVHPSAPSADMTCALVRIDVST